MAVEAQNKARKLGITCPDTLWEVSSLRSAYLVLRGPQWVLGWDRILGWIFPKKPEKTRGSLEIA